MANLQRRYGLLLIDIQQGFNDPTHWGKSWSTSDFASNITKLLEAFRAAAEPENIFHVAHHSKQPESALHPVHGNVAFQPYAAPRPGESIFTKHVNSGFIGTDLEATIRKRQITDLVIAGLTTDHCVSTTTRMAANLGVVDGAVGSGEKGRILLVKDASATYEKEFEGCTIDAETLHTIHLASLNEEFCEVTSTDAVLQELKSL